MPSKYYLPSTGAAAVNPAYDAGWAITTGANRLAMVTAKISSAMANQTVAYGSQAGGDFGLVRQYVGPQIAAQTISGTVKAQIRCSETDAANNVFARMGLRVVSADGSTVRGTLLAVANYGPTTELVTSLTNRIYADGDTLTNVVAQAGDRIVAEFGIGRSLSWIGDASLNFGDDSGTDLPEDESTTAANNPWLEFSMTIVPYGLTQAVADALSVADAIAFTMGKVLTDAATLADALALKTGKVITDAASLADAVSAVLYRQVSITEAIAIAEAMALKTGKVLSEAALTLGDTVSPLLVNLPPVQMRYAPRPLLTLTIGATTKRYSTEDVLVPAAGQVGVAQVGESQVGG